MVAEARDRARRGDAERGLDHAADHDAEAERPGRVHHADRLADPAALRELDVHAVHSLGAGGDVGERVAVLVDVDREAPSAPAARRRPGRLRAAAARRTRRRVPASSGIASSASSSDQYSFTSTWSGSGGRAPHRADAFDVEPVPTAELQLEAPEPPVRARLGARRHVVRVAEPDGVGGGRRAARHAEQSPDGLAAELPAQVVQGRVERRPGGLARRGSPRDAGSISSSANGSVPSDPRAVSSERVADSMLSP